MFPRQAKRQTRHCQSNWLLGIQKVPYWLLYAQPESQSYYCHRYKTSQNVKKSNLKTIFLLISLIVLVFRKRSKKEAGIFHACGWVVCAYEPPPGNCLFPPLSQPNCSSHREEFLSAFPRTHWPEIETHEGIFSFISMFLPLCTVERKSHRNAEKRWKIGGFSIPFFLLFNLPFVPTFLRGEYFAFLLRFKLTLRR